MILTGENRSAGSDIRPGATLLAGKKNLYYKFFRTSGSDVGYDLT
jgi:hypothetical protein